MQLIPRRREEWWPDPFRELERIQRDMTSLFGDTLAKSGQRDVSVLEQAWAPAIDVQESESGFTVKADLPGLEKKDIEVTLRDNVLAIKGEKKEEFKEKHKGVLRSERFYGRFYRELAFQDGVDEAKIQAAYKNGVLELTIPKKEEAKPKQVKVDVQ